LTRPVPVSRVVCLPALVTTNSENLPDGDSLINTKLRGLDSVSVLRGKRVETVARSRQVYMELELWKHLLTIFLPQKRADTYRHKEMRSIDRPTYSAIQLVLPG
jgi:hypothetical protein